MEFSLELVVITSSYFLSTYFQTPNFSPNFLFATLTAGFLLSRECQKFNYKYLIFSGNNMILIFTMFLFILNVFILLCMKTQIKSIQLAKL